MPQHSRHSTLSAVIATALFLSFGSRALSAHTLSLVAPAAQLALVELQVGATEPPPADPKPEPEPQPEPEPEPQSEPEPSSTPEPPAEPESTPAPTPAPEPEPETEPESEPEPAATPSPEAPDSPRSRAKDVGDISSLDAPVEEPAPDPAPDPEAEAPDPSPEAPETPRSRPDATDDISTIDAPKTEGTPESDAPADIEDAPDPTPSEGPDLEVLTEAETETPKSRAVPPPDEITAAVEEEKKLRRGIFPQGPLVKFEDAWNAFNTKLDEKTNLRMGFAYTVLFQQATGGPGDRTASAGDIDVFGRWRIIDKDPGWYGTLSFALEQRHRIGDVSPNSLGDQIGSTWNTSRAFGDAPAALKEVWWRQRLFDDLFQVTVGKTNPKHLTNTNRLAAQNYFFLNSAFSDNPVRVFPENGPGVTVRFQPNKDIYLTADVRAADAQRTSVSTNNLSSGHVAYAAELGFTPKFKDLGVGHYRFTMWHTPDSQKLEEQTGFAISFDQEIGRYIPFLRYSINNTDDTFENEHPVEQIFALGVGVGSPPHRPDDYWGVAGAWSRPVKSSLRDQWAFEAFYRFQVTTTQQLTFGAQLILDPSNAPDDDAIGIFECRWRVAF